MKPLDLIILAVLNLSILQTNGNYRRRYSIVELFGSIRELKTDFAQDPNTSVEFYLKH